MTPGTTADPRLPDYVERSAPEAAILGWLLLAGLLLALLWLLPSGGLGVGVGEGLIALGLIGIWRWSWAGTHFVRAIIYRVRVFPRLRAASEAARLPPSLHIVVTSYRMPAEVNAAVYSRLFAAVERMRVPTTVVACVTDAADARVLHAVFGARRRLPEGTAMHILPQDGTGKRSAMVDALRLIATGNPPPGAQLVLMDGDTLLPPDALERTCRFLAAFPDVGAVTTGNQPLVRGNAMTREWYRLRLSQRDALMSSMALSRRLLVLTGRFSVFRMEVASAPGFALGVARDSIEHWRLGRIPMVTGDDKSTWFTTLRAGWRMLYVPDVVVGCAEELPAGGFVKATRGLMLRWYGNMARNNGRALALGPKRLGLYVWLCLLDQRIAPWTTLLGPTLMLIASILYGSVFIVLYLLWILTTRTLLTFLDWAATGRFHPAFPLLLYYNQVVGAVIKIFAFNNPDRQRWNRQALAGNAAGRMQGWVSNGYMAASLGAFVLVVVMISGRLQPQITSPRPTGVEALFNRQAHPDDHLRAPCGTARAAPCAAVTGLPGGPIP